jgi:signal transduction histidine kinase
VLTNAIRYTPAGGSVDVVCRRDAACMEFTVRDDGIGIAATELPRIFERGFRGGGAESQAGSGIGLSLVKDFVDAAGGSIAVESVVAQGSTFTVRLPGSFGRAATVCDCALAHGAQAG